MEAQTKTFLRPYFIEIQLFKIIQAGIQIITNLYSKTAKGSKCLMTRFLVAVSFQYMKPIYVLYLIEKDNHFIFS